jgi:hypothetical protein
MPRVHPALQSDARKAQISPELIHLDSEPGIATGTRDHSNAVPACQCVRTDAGIFDELSPHFLPFAAHLGRMPQNP